MMYIVEQTEKLCCRAGKAIVLAASRRRCKTPLKNAVLARPADIVYAKTNSPRGPRIEMKFKPREKETEKGKGRGSVFSESTRT